MILVSEMGNVRSLNDVAEYPYTVPLMHLRTLPVTSTCPYGENSTIITGYYAMSGWLNLLPAGKKSRFLAQCWIDNSK